MSIRKMTCDQWCMVMDNPRQRPTERHAERALKQHLKEYSITQDTVFAASLPGGVLVKLDGHTRAFLWEIGMLKKPPCVYVRVYSVMNMEEAKELYTHFDSRPATETTREQIGGAMAEAGIAPKSGLLNYGAYKSALTKLQAGAKSVYQIVSGWRREIQLLDSVGFTKNSLKAGGVLGALVLLRTRTVDPVLEFLDLIRHDRGIKTEKGSDAVEMFCRLNEQTGGSGGEASIYELAGRMVALYDGHLAKRLYRNAPRCADVRALLEQHEKTEESA